MTSKLLSKAMKTNPVVVRRTMAGLREAGFVRSTKGHGGGWTLSCDLEKVTLRDIYDALGAPSLLTNGNRAEAPECLVEQAVNNALDQSFEEAEAVLLARFGEVTLSMLHRDVSASLAARGQSHPPERDLA